MRVRLTNIAKGITTHFPARASEWLLAGMLTAWGYILLRPDDLFGAERAYAQMKIIAPESIWGSVAVAIGVLRILALGVNGTFLHTWYGRFSPHVRSAMACLSCGVWTNISLGIYLTGVITTGIAIYPGLALLDAWNMVRASGDAGEADGGRQARGWE